MQVGKKLRNGAEVRRWHETQSGCVVLAFWEHGDPCKWVTWMVDAGGNTFWGHYHADEVSAVADFNERVTRC